MRIARKIEVEFEVIDDSGHRLFQIEEVEIPIKHDKDLDDNSFVELYSRQIENYLDSLDKLDLIYDNNWSLIVDWSIKTRKQKVIELFQDCKDAKKDWSDDLIHTYIKMEDVISEYSFEEQIRIVLYSYSLVQDGVSTALKRMNEKIETILDHSNERKERNRRLLN